MQDGLEFNSALVRLVRRQYKRVLAAQAGLVQATQTHHAARVHGALRRSSALTPAEAAAMILRAWRRRKMQRVAAHFDKVVVFDK